MLKSLDYMGDKVTLFNQGSDRWQTKTGGLTTIFLFLFSCGAVVAFGIDIVLKENPILGFSTNVAEDNRLPIPDLNLVVAMFPGTPVINANVDPERHFSFKMVYYEVKSFEESEITVIKLEKCQNTALFKENKQNILETITYLPKFYYCIPESFEKELYGARANSGSSIITAEISVCTEKECAPVEETLKEIEGYTAQVMVSDHFVDGFNVDSPVQHSFFSVAATSIASTSLNFEIYLRHLDFLSDDGWIFVRNQETRTFKVSDYNLTSASRENNPLITKFNVFFDSKLEVSRRTYIKIQEVTAKVGGFMKVMLTVSSLILNSWTKNKRMQTELIRLKQAVLPNLTSQIDSSSNAINKIEISKLESKVSQLANFTKNWRNWLPLSKHRAVLKDYKVFYQDIMSVDLIKAISLDYLHRNKIDLKEWNKQISVKEGSLFIEGNLLKSQNFMV